ncbi:MAG: tetratricopeptide repeat protein [Leptolyngbyaceae cyanobacterium bins.59]|nr:tetratricopeptide repeat protein [Leptolyngbyaceae cyanobacterium bins.59]
MSLAELPEENVVPSREEVYQALLRSLRRRKGFGIVFIQCSPLEAESLIHQIEQDLPQKKTGVLTLPEPIENLFNLLCDRLTSKPVEMMIIQGLEHSLEAYIKPGYGGDGDYYNLDTVPPILNHLNQQRERFRDKFPNTCFVFILPLFAVKYFIRRAPDFFDWVSGPFTLPLEDAAFQQLSEELLSTDWSDLQPERSEERLQKILAIDELLSYPTLPIRVRTGLLREEGLLLASEKKNLEALHCFEAALQAHRESTEQMQSDCTRILKNQGDVLYELGRYEEAIAAYDTALESDPNLREAWTGRGHALHQLGRELEAEISYERGIDFQQSIPLEAFSEEENPSLSELLRQYLEEDPDHILQVHLTNAPDITFQKLALAYISGTSWSDLARTYGVPLAILVAFFQRQLARLSPKIYKSLERFI